MTTEVLTPDVVIVGAGPAGLTAAAQLAPRSQGRVLVLERERTAGGIPRHSDHLGYGIRDLHRFVSGPAYARALVERATKAGAEILTEAMVTGWAADRSLDVTTPQGRLRIDARAVVLATGARERPRPARLIPGGRPSGVYTTGHLQNIVHLQHGRVGKKAVVVGGESVGWSAVLTLRHAGCQTVLMTTEYPKPDSYLAFSALGTTFLRTPVATRTRVTKIVGRSTVEAVEVTHLDTGERRTVECDTVVLTGGWIPDHELFRAAGLAIDPATLGPVVDTALRTDRPGVFAVGNVLHPVDTADVAALDGAHVARHVLAWLDGATVPDEQIRLVADAPLRWVAPTIIRPGDPAPPGRRLSMWTDEYVPFPRIVLRQGGKVIARRRTWWPAAPGRVFRIPSRFLKNVDPTGDPVHIQLDR